MGSSAKPSMYGNTPNIEEKKKEDKEKVATAVLSITAKQKKKNAEKGKKDGEEKMDVDTEKKEDKKEKMEVDEKKDEKKEDGEEKKKEAEPLFEMLANPARVMKAQLKVVTLEDARYRPMKDLSIGGIVLLDRAELGAEDEEQIVEPMEVNRGASSSSEEEGEEPAPPEPFQWTED